MLPAIAGWPTSAVDFLLLCRAPMEEVRAGKEGREGGHVYLYPFIPGHRCSVFMRQSAVGCKVLLDVSLDDQLSDADDCARGRSILESVRSSTSVHVPNHVVWCS